MDPLFKEIQFNRELNQRSGSNTATERGGSFQWKYFKESSGYEDEESYQKYQRMSKFSQITNYRPVSANIHSKPFLELLNEWMGFCESF